MRKDVDYLVIGQGMAGSMLAWYLIKKGCKVMVVDPGSGASALVAGGVYNPVTGRKIVKGWLADTLVPFAEETYSAMEKELGVSFLRRTGMYRMLGREEDRQLVKDAMETGTNTFLKGLREEPLRGFKEAPHGIVEVAPAGYIRTAVFIQAVREWLKQHKAYRQSSFQYKDLIIDEEGVRWHDIAARQIVFCEGPYGVHNPWFNRLPFAPVKGELLTIKAPGLYDGKIVSRSIGLVPLGEDIFRVGATFEWNDLSQQPTEKARQFLTEKLDETLTVPYEVVGHEAGIRPATKQRRPFLGRHTVYPQMSIFNGLGTKGILLAPYFAKQMAEFLTEGTSLMPEVDIAKFSKELELAGV